MCEKKTLEAKNNSEIKILMATAQASRVASIAGARTHVISKKGAATAAVMTAKADAWSKYGDEAYLDMVIAQLPAITRNFTAPLKQMGKITMLSSDGELGADKITDEVGLVMGQIPEVIRSITGIDMEKLLSESKSAPEPQFG